MARIREGLEHAVVVVGVVGTDTDACRWQQREMLHADYVGLPAVAFRIQTVALPICMNNLQPIELRAPLAPSASFEMLARALVRTASARVQLARSGSDAVVDSAQREREQVYLRDLLYRDLPDHEGGYEPVGGLERTERSLARSHKRPRQDVEVILRAVNRRMPAGLKPRHACGMTCSMFTAICHSGACAVWRCWASRVPVNRSRLNALPATSRAAR